MRWLLTSWGSYGDLHPFLALGRGLIARGDAVTLVGHPDWASETERAGLRFVPTAEPSRENFLREHPEVLSMSAGGLASLHALVRHAIAPSFDPVLAALLAEAPSHDALVAHHFSFMAPVAAEISGLPFATVSLAPGVVPSAHSLPGASFGRAGQGPLGRSWNRFVWSCGRVITSAMVDPVVNRIRTRNGLRLARDVVFGAHSERLNLQLYSRHFAPPPPDWTAEKQVAGFCFYDPPGAKLDPAIEAFLAGGEAPVLFTLGSVAVQEPGSFFEDAFEAIHKLGLRGILLAGPAGLRQETRSTSVLVAPYAPYGLLMPRVRAVVHQCGIGTLSHTLRAGVPSVACPFAFDQPNNARRLEALGIAQFIAPRDRDAGHLASSLGRLLESPAPARAKILGEAIRAEDGVARACDLLRKNVNAG